jgi:ornithine--oxo-acid transaminase
MNLTHVAKNYKTLLLDGTKFLINRAKGSLLFDTNNNAYIDGTSSYCAANFGHNHPQFKKVLLDQVELISVCPRFVDNEPLDLLGATIDKHLHCELNINPGSYLQVLPSCNGVDTIETAIKLARAWGHEKKGIPIGESKQLFFGGNFHGRSMSAVSVSDYSYQKKFYPKNPNLVKIPFNNVYALEKYLCKNPTVSAIIIEPIQCEAGIIIPEYNYLSIVRQLCSYYKVLMICDEIQTGMFRSGPLLCSEKFNVKPDVVLLGKSLGGGFLPVSVCISSNEIMGSIKAGEHGSTFGGYPLASAVASYVLDYGYSNNYEQIVNDKAEYYKLKLSKLSSKYGFIKEIRQCGLIIGIELDQSINSDYICNKLVSHGIIVKSTINNTIRITPPFIITNEQTNKIFDKLDECFSNLSN